MAISVSEAILRRQGGGPSYADLQSPIDQTQNFTQTPNLGVGAFSNLTDSLTSGMNSASKNIGNFFTAPEVGAVSNFFGKVGDAVSFLNPAGYALSGIAGLSEFNALNEALSKYGVPEDQQLGVKDALIAALPGPTLQGQYTNALNQFNENMMENVRDDMFNAAFANTSVPSRGGFAGSPGDPAQGSGAFSAGSPGDPAQGADVSSDMGDDSDLGGYGGFGDDDGSTI